MKNTPNILNEFVQNLIKDHPLFHGRENAGTKCYAIQFPVLKWIINNLPYGGNTFETGCGYSTVILAALSKKHTVVSPFSGEHDLIREWCEKYSISTDHLDFVVGNSQDIVPNIKLNDLDLILIDGDHAFPAPFIDWYYTADLLNYGGILIVDDTHIPTGKILRDFLVKEYNRWDLVTEIDKSAIFKRNTRDRVAKGLFWTQQPYCDIN